MLYPLKFEPIYKEVVWGGRNLEKYFSKSLPESVPIGESWELTNREEGVSIISNGHLRGMTIQEAIDNLPNEMLGEDYKEYKDRFPLLLKIIDANDNLSIQVHPDGMEGKTEAWYILHAEPGAKIVYGLRDKISKEDFVQAIDKDTIKDVIKEIEVHAGEFYFIPGGRVHALGKGIVVFEVQQNSNTTYRVYDWGRLGLDGKPRQLHIDQALDVIDFFDEIGLDTTKYLRFPFVCKYFTVEKISIDSECISYLDGKKFEVLFALEGDLTIRYNGRFDISIKAYETVFLPACLGEYKLYGIGSLLKVYI